MPSILDAGPRDAVYRRIAALTPDTRPRWGRFSADAMLRHLSQSARMALGELHCVPRGRRAFRTFPLKHLILYVLPFPKGAPTAPELLAAPASAFEAERETLLALMRRFADGPREGPGPEHPLFGPLSRSEWGALVHKHSDHHLRQFGV